MIFTLRFRIARWLLPVLCLASALARSEELTVAAAADLQFAMQDIAAGFEKETSASVKVTYGSSGNFLQQIRNGAPFDIFFSANIDYAKQLEAAGLVEPGTLYTYARGKIVVWTRNDSSLDMSGGLKALLNPRIKKIAVANPEHAPYGMAAVAALRYEGIYDNLKDRLVMGENISQTMSFVTSGAADAGVVALSLALSPMQKDKGRYGAIPDSDYPPIEQACVILRSAKNKDAAKRFLLFLKTSKASAILRSYGFDVQGDATGP